MAGVAQLGEQQTEASLAGRDSALQVAFWRSRVQSTVLAFFFHASEVGDGENMHDAYHKKILAQFTVTLTYESTGMWPQVY